MGFLDKTGSLIEPKSTDDYIIVQILNLLNNEENSHQDNKNYHRHKIINNQEIYIGLSKTTIAKILDYSKSQTKVNRLIDRLEKQELIKSDIEHIQSKELFFRITQTGGIAFKKLKEIFLKSNDQIIPKFLHSCLDIDKKISVN